MEDSRSEFLCSPEMCEVGKGGDILLIDLTGSPHIMRWMVRSPTVKPHIITAPHLG